MYKGLTRLLIIFIFINPVIAEETVWYCNPVKSAGLDWDIKNKEYSVTRFKGLDRLVIKQGEDNQLTFPKDKKGIEEYKSEDCRESLAGSRVSCSDGDSNFSINFKDGLATSSSSGGWTYFGKQMADSMHVTAYECEKF